jgi:hypothetical protein
VVRKRKHRMSCSDNTTKRCRILVSDTPYQMHTSGVCLVESGPVNVPRRVVKLSNEVPAGTRFRLSVETSLFWCFPGNPSLLPPGTKKASTTKGQNLRDQLKGISAWSRTGHGMLREIADLGDLKSEVLGGVTRLSGRVSPLLFAVLATRVNTLLGARSLKTKTS